MSTELPPTALPNSEPTDQSFKPHPEPMPPLVANPQLPDTRKWFRNRLVVFLIILPILAGVVALAYQQYTKPVINDQAFVITTDVEQENQVIPEMLEASEETQPVQELEVVRFKGVVTEVQNDCIFDGECALKIDEFWVVVSSGMLAVADSQMGQILQPNGSQFSGELSELIGSQVEVTAELRTDGKLTLVGSNEYVVRIVEQVQSVDDQPEASGESDIQVDLDSQ